MPIPAIVLSNEKRRGLAALVFSTYNAHWPDNNLDFRIPVNDVRSIAGPIHRPYPKNVTLVPTRTAVQAAMDDLLAPFEDEDWLFWAMDGRYLSGVFNISALKQVEDFVLANDDPTIDGIKLLPWQEILSEETLRIGDQVFSKQTQSGHQSICHHQFLRCRVLRRLFQGQFSDAVTIEAVDHPEFFASTRLDDFNVYVPDRKITHQGAPMVGSNLTLNGRRMCEIYDCETPNYEERPIVADYANPFCRNPWSGVVPQSTRSTAHPDPSPTRKRALEAVRKSPFPGHRTDGIEADYVIVSYGGVGSKALVKSVGEETQSAVDHTHWRFQPRQADRAIKFVYVFGDPRNSVQSFFDRRENIHERHGFDGVHRAGIQAWVDDHCINLQGDWEHFCSSWDIVAFLSQSNDLLRLEEQFYNWFFNPEKLDVVFVRYETMWENELEIAALLGLEKLNLPKKVTRQSDWTDLPAQITRMLDLKYGDLARRLEGLSDVFEVA
jgi:hypothetical protein